MVRLNNELEIEPRPPNEFDNDLSLNDALSPSESLANEEAEENRENQGKDELFREFISDVFSDSEDEVLGVEDAPMANGDQLDEAARLMVTPKDRPWESYKVWPGNGAGGYGRANRDWEAEERVEDLRVEEEQKRVKHQELKEEEERVKLQKQAEEKARLLKEQEKQKEKSSLYRQIVDQKIQGREIRITGTGIEAGVGTINQAVVFDAQRNQDLQINDGSQPSRPSLHERRLQRPSDPQPVRRVDVGSNFIVHEPQKAGVPDKINPYPNGREMPMAMAMSIRVPEQQNLPNNLSPSRLSLTNSPILPIPSPTERRFNALDPVDAQAFLGLGIISPSGINTLCGINTPIRLESPHQALRPDVFNSPNFKGGKVLSREDRLDITKLIALCQANKKILDLGDERAEEARTNLRRYNTLKTVLSTLRSRGTDGRLAIRPNPGFVQEIQKQWNHRDRIIFHNLAVNRIKLAGTEIEMPIFPTKFPRGSPTRMENMDARGCSFCLYECGWGVADRRVLLSPEHATGYCESCDKKTISFQGSWVNTRDINFCSAGARQPNNPRVTATEERYGQLKDLTEERPAFGSKGMDARNARRGSIDNLSAKKPEVLRQNSSNDSSQRINRNPLQEIGALAGRSLVACSAGQPSQYPQRPRHGQTDESSDRDRMQGQFHQQPQYQGVRQSPAINSERLHSAVELGPGHSPRELARYEYSFSGPDEQHMTLRGGAGEQLDHQSPLMYKFTGGFLETPQTAFGIGPNHTPQELARHEFSFSSPKEQHMSLRGGAGDISPQESDEENDEPGLPPKVTKNGGKPPLPKRKSGSRPPKQKMTKNSGKSSQSETVSPSIQKKTGNSAAKPSQAKKSGSRQPKLTRNGGKPPLSSPAPATGDEPAPTSDFQPDRVFDEEDDGAILYQVRRSYGQNGKSATTTTGPRKPAAASRGKPKAAAARDTTTFQVQDGEEEEDEEVEDTMVGTSAGKQLSDLSRGRSPVAPPARLSSRRGSNSSITESHASDFPSQKKKAREQASTPGNPSKKKRGPQGTLSSEPPHKIRNPDRKPDDRRIGPNKKEVEIGLHQASEAPERYVPYFDIHSGLDKDQKKSFLEDGRSAAKERQMPAPRTLDDVVAQGLIPIPALVPRRLKHNQDEEVAYRGFWGWRYEHQQIAKRNGKSFESLVQDGIDFMVEPAGNDVPNPPPKGNDPAGYAIARSARDIAMAASSLAIPSSTARPRKNQASSSRGTMANSSPARSSSPLLRKGMDPPNQLASSPPERMVSSASTPFAPQRSGDVNFSNGFNGSSPMQGHENQMGSSPPGNMAGFSEAQGNAGFGADRGRGSANSYAHISASLYEVGRSSPEQNPSGGFQQTMPGARSASRPNVGSKIPSMQSMPQPLAKTRPTPSSSSSFNNFQNSSAQMSPQPRPRFTPFNAPRNPSGLRYSQIASPLLPPQRPHFTHVGPQHHRTQQHFQPNQFLLPPQLPPFPPIPYYMPQQHYDEFLQPGPLPQSAQNLENQENIPPAPPSSPPSQFGTTPSQDGSPNRDGILLCYGSPYGQIDVTKARICEHCRAKKLEIINHRHYNFIELSKLGGEISGYVNAELEDGRRMRACMICPAQAYWRCQGCPLKVCESCKVLLVSQCKGLVENLLKWHFTGHVRNDVSILVSCSCLIWTEANLMNRHSCCDLMVVDTRSLNTWSWVEVWKQRGVKVLFAGWFGLCRDTLFISFLRARGRTIEVTDLAF